MDRRKARVFAAVLVGSVGCDHAAKQIAQHALAGSPGISMGGDLVRFELANNPGAFLGLGSSLPEEFRQILFVTLVPLLLGVVVIASVRAGLATRWAAFGLALVIGGGLGNWLDRLMHDGTVTDFVRLGIGGIRTGIFNFADVWILAGVALLVLTPRREPVEPTP